MVGVFSGACGQSFLFWKNELFLNENKIIIFGSEGRELDLRQKGDFIV